MAQYLPYRCPHVTIFWQDNSDEFLYTMNLTITQTNQTQTVRPAGPADARAVQRLIETSSRSHVHPDWRPVTDWLGRAPAFVAEGPAGLTACLLSSVDPAPAAWVRAAAVAGGFSAPVIMRGLFPPCLAALADRDIQTLSAMPAEPWLAPILDELGFAIVEQVETWRKPDLMPACCSAQDVMTRPAHPEEMDELAHIDHLAFHPRWRFSLESLVLAWEQAATFTVAARDGQLVGFQISLADQIGAHLARLTVRPDAQRTGVGSSLLADALARYARLGINSVSLNTQVHNTPSHRLYSAFGFEPVSPPIPVWERLV
jgi:ribosomal protein S18 acetylase RimI-like enzyme